MPEQEIEDVFENLDGTIDDGSKKDEVNDDEFVEDAEEESEEIEDRNPMMEDDDDDEDIEIEIIDDPEDEEEEEEEEIKPKQKKRKENYSARVRKRIDREKKVTYQERQRNDQLQNELNASHQELDELRKSNIDNRITNIDSRIDSTKEKLTAAIEAGETATQVTQQEELAKLQANRAQAESDKANYQPVRRETTRRTGSKAEDWIFAQSSWYNKNAEATKAANAIDSSLTSEGYDQNTDEYFEELNRRLSRRYPNLVKSDENDDDDELEEEEEVEARKKPKPKPKSKSKPVSARVDQIPAGAKKKRSSSKIQLTRNDLANMERFGLDTKDPKVLKEYARNKL